jgi:hypothetical protein
MTHDPEKYRKTTRTGETPSHNGLFQAFFVGNSEFPAALFAAACEQFATVFGFHAFTEAVFVFAGAAGRLVRAFHCYGKLSS